MLTLKIKNYLTLKKFLAIITLSLLITANLQGVLTAQTVTRGYGSDQVLQRGMVVGLTKKDKAKVEPINISHPNDILGVVVNANDSPITISSEAAHVFIATNGRFDILVSDQNGPIRASDYITLSAIAGIGMKANGEQSTVIGRAGSGFDGKTNVLSSSKLTGGNGSSRTAHISRIPVDIAIGKNPLVNSNTNAPAFLTNAGKIIAGRSVSAVRLYLGAIIFIIGIIIAGSIIYAGIRGSMISIGRNPLSKRGVMRSMVGVIITSLLVLGTCVLGVFLILRL